MQMHNKKSPLFAKGQRGLSILSLSLPIIIAQLGSILQGWADTIMVGQYGTDELSAAGFVNNLYNLILYFLLGVSYATTPVVGSHFSRGEFSAVRQAKHDSIIVNLLTSLAVAALLTVLYFNIEALGQPTQLLPLIKPYFLVLLVSLPFIAVFNSLKQTFDAMGDTRTPMWVMLSGNIFNILLNFLLIFGSPLTPALGLLGAGIATLLSRLAMMLALLICKERPSYTSTSAPSSSSAVPKRHILTLFRLGIPIGVQLSLEACSFNIAAIFMGWIGTTALAAHQVMATISTFCFMIIYGICSAAAIRISHFRGVGDLQGVRRTSTTALFISLVCVAVMATIILLLARPIASAFTTSEDVILLVIAMMIPFVCYQLGDCLQICYANSLRAVEDVRYLMPFAFIAYCVVSLPLAYLFAFPLQMGAVGIWWSFPFGLTTAGILYYCRFRYVIRKRG